MLNVVAPFSFAQEAPKNIEEAKTLGERILKGFPQALKGSWQEALGIWGRMANWFKGVWDSYISPFFKSIWAKLMSILGKEVEERKPEIKEGLKDEIEEMKEGVSQTGKSFWQRFKELIN